VRASLHDSGFKSHFWGNTLPLPVLCAFPLATVGIPSYTIMMDGRDVSNSGGTFETALAALQPIRDLAKNWDIDIAAWCVPRAAYGERRTAVRMRKSLVHRFP
jgi:hypothetical protein